MANSLIELISEHLQNRSGETTEVSLFASFNLYIPKDISEVLGKVMDQYPLEFELVPETFDVEEVNITPISTADPKAGSGC